MISRRHIAIAASLFWGVTSSFAQSNTVQTLSNYAESRVENR